MPENRKTNLEEQKRREFRMKPPQLRKRSYVLREMRIESPRTVKEGDLEDSLVVVVPPAA